jgi:probable F420-dependent oxidoreductase
LATHRIKRTCFNEDEGVGVSAGRPRPFRFGVLAQSVLSRKALLNTARRAEDKGFSTFLIRDHFIAEPFGHQFAPLTALASVAGMTKALRIGSLVLGCAYRHPVLLAKEIATLDVISEGRVELGLGTGFSRVESERAGLAFDPPRARLERLEEVLHVLKGLFADEPLRFTGKHYSATDLDGFPKPVQRPHPPILIGGAGARLLSIAAQEADIIGFQTVETKHGVLSREPTARLADNVMRKIEQVRQTAGTRFRKIELSTVASVIVTDRREEAADRFARAQGWSAIPTERVLEMPSVFIGTAGQIIVDMQMRRERFGFSYYVIFDQVMNEVAPIVSRLAGT